LIATYDATATSPYPKRALNPPPTFNTITDQATLQSIANTIGTHLNREIAKIEVILPVYGSKVRLGGPAGSTAAYWEPAFLPTIQSYAGLGALSPTYVITDIEIDGGVQKLILSDLPFTADDMQYLVQNTITNAVVASNVQAAAPATAVIPVGAMLPFPVNVNIVGWLACNGSTFNAATYPTLARLLGGNTVPDMRDRLPMGANALGVVPIGQQAGSASHKLLTSEMPVYPSDHPVAAAGAVAVATSTVGANTPFPLIPPVLGVAWYIKAL
jgi:Phage Tail Collar Domain